MQLGVHTVRLGSHRSQEVSVYDISLAFLMNLGSLRLPCGISKVLRVNSDLLALMGLGSALDDELNRLSYVNAAWSGVTPLSRPQTIPTSPYRLSIDDHSASRNISAESVIVQNPGCLL